MIKKNLKQDSESFKNLDAEKAKEMEEMKKSIEPHLKKITNYNFRKEYFNKLLLDLRGKDTELFDKLTKLADEIDNKEDYILLEKAIKEIEDYQGK